MEQLHKAPACQWKEGNCIRDHANRALHSTCKYCIMEIVHCEEKELTGFGVVFSLPLSQDFV